MDEEMLIEADAALDLYNEMIKKSQKKPGKIK